MIVRDLNAALPNFFVRLMLVTLCLSVPAVKEAAGQGCCSPGSPAAGGFEKGGLETGQLRFLPSVSFTDMGKLVGGDKEIYDPSNRKMDAWEYELDVEYGLTSRFTILASTRYTYRSRRLRGVTPGGTPVSFDAQARGFGDLVVFGKYKLASWNLRTQREISIGAGAGFPTGAYDEKESGIRISRDLLPGTGSYQIILWSFFYRSFRPGPLGVSLSTTYKRAGVSADGYRYGATFECVAGAVYEINDPVGVSVRAGGRWVGTDKLPGLELAGTGGHEVYVQPGLEVKASTGVSFYALLRMPVYFNLNGTQLMQDYSVRIGGVLVWTTTSPN